MHNFVTSLIFKLLYGWDLQTIIRSDAPYDNLVPRAFLTGVGGRGIEFLQNKIAAQSEFLCTSMKNLNVKFPHTMASLTSTHVTKAPCEAKGAMMVVLRQRLSDSSVIICIRMATMIQRESKESCYFFSLFFFFFSCSLF